MQLLRQRFKTVDDNVDDGYLGFRRRLDVPVRDPCRCATCNPVIAVPHVLVDDQVHRARFIFERNERDALGGSGPLTQQHQAGHADRRIVGQIDEPACGRDAEAIELVAVKRNRVGTQRETGRAVIGDDLFVV